MSPARTVLIIEDDPDIAELVRVQLEKDGFAVTVKTGGQQGIDHALAAPPDLIVLDLRMSPVDGFEVLARLGDDERTRNVPILVISIVEEEGRARAAGARGFVLKPFRPANLTDAIREVLP